MQAEGYEENGGLKRVQVLPKMSECVNCKQGRHNALLLEGKGIQIGYNITQQQQCSW